MVSEVGIQFGKTWKPAKVLEKHGRRSYTVVTKMVQFIVEITDIL